MSSEASESGFTLIELVVVIVIIGILAAAALPRFVDLTGEARESAAQGLAGSLSGSVAMVKGKYEAGDGTSPVSAGGADISVNGSGYPTVSSDNLSALLQQDPGDAGSWTFEGSTATGSSNYITWKDNSGDPSWAVKYNPNTGVAFGDSKSGDF